MTRDEIIEIIAKDKEYMTICRQVTALKADQYAEDLYQELFLIIMALPEQRLKDLYATCFRCYYYRMAERQFYSDNSRFHKTMRKPGTFIRARLEDIAAFYDHTPIEPEVIERLNRAMNELPFVDGELLKLYADRKSVKQVSKDSGVPIRSVYKIISNAKRNVQIKVERYKRTEK
ncbi:RNA polymerase sigma factor [Chitinophaga cymbidii]|uniref:RNA polymerase sigma factor 70 region 4 type 2 domain-containing protein n=1 Tax=Chitinophaga cymbidii TaxID=1096750 RepID=A0A512RIL6_9BACT|nr:sigma-70 family RNA polymerase sigma factor [Chitinophaga cymbidii]GEP95551.1 hypothetical protein CCY01nite_18110 [Chitinophaga cymbidii]